MAKSRINKNSLEFPREARRSIKPSYDPDAFGRWSEKFARFLGTARFLVYMTAFVFTWVIWNGFAPENLKFDHYPFIFLTLLLSLQASYAAPLILLAQNRQSDRDRIQGNEDRERDERNVADTEYLARELASLRSAIGEVTTRDYLHSEISDAIEEIVKKLNSVKGLTDTFVKTKNGFKVTNPEGYVAIDRVSGGAVKLVDRMEFSYNNFTAIKAWDK